ERQAGVPGGAGRAAGRPPLARPPVRPRKPARRRPLKPRDSGGERRRRAPGGDGEGARLAGHVAAVLAAPDAHPHGAQGYPGLRQEPQRRLLHLLILLLECSFLREVMGENPSLNYRISLLSSV
ncbi:uncharacterized protein LOC122259311, partial [Penaeus japonicus]|uniref:uncharacterized protein LOC122259311 n=1 Tax=Penaeus japonicus TaxID=27405 RepID=UPI001C70AFEC